MTDLKMPSREHLTFDDVEYDIGKCGHCMHCEFRDEAHPYGDSEAVEKVFECTATDDEDCPQLDKMWELELEQFHDEVLISLECLDEIVDAYDNFMNASDKFGLVICNELRRDYGIHLYGEKEEQQIMFALGATISTFDLEDSDFRYILETSYRGWRIFCLSAEKDLIQYFRNELV